MIYCLKITMYKCIFIVLSASLLWGCYSADVSSHDWDHFVYSVEWPATVCLDSNLSHKHQCAIPANVSTWTVHGLWPTNGNSMGPEYCNKSAKFDHKGIVGILDDLNMYWPNLYTDSDPDDFWIHEWEKHGTCSMNFPPLDSELKYFKKGLDIRKKLDILTVMKKGGILPRDDYTYQFHAVLNVLQKFLLTPTLMCTYDKETQTQYLGEIEFCLDKNFTLMNCAKKQPRQQNVLTLEKLSLLSLQRLESSLRAGGSSQSNVISMLQQKVLSKPSLASVRPCNPKAPIAFPVIHPTKK